MKLVSLRSALVCSLAILFVQSSWALNDGDGTSVTCDNSNPYGNPYFGDTHAHTTYSVDAYTQGTETTPDQAYRFAKGEQIGLHPFELGSPTRFAQIDRPLDFAIVTDHAEFFGEQNICLDPAHPLYNEQDCVNLRARTSLSLLQWNVLLGAAQNNVARFGFCGPNGSICTGAFADTWQLMQDAAEDHYDRSSDCTFTTFIGYEWTGAPTANYGNGGLETLNLHRNVVFRNRIVPARPMTYLDSGYPEHLWNSLQSGCLDLVDPSGNCDVITIPHNSNLSQGKIFETVQPSGNPYNSAAALKRQKFEPLVEVMQHKGQSECLPMVTDELCDFEVIPWGHLAGNFIGATVPKVEGTVRDVLKKGLSVHSNLGFNPFRYGMIGSTDTHLGTPGLAEESASYPGHGGAAGGASGTAVFAGVTDTPEFNPGGLAVVWAQQNSRAALFDAMKRREVYATSGPRHVVRFYGSWDLPSDICAQPNLVQIGHDTAVPMGGLLQTAAEGRKPKFVVQAAKDAGTPGRPGFDLQRIQIIKGWRDAAGALHEEVYDVAGNPANGIGVDLGSCTVTGGTGDAELCGWWEDTNFNPDQRSFYYARVVENPSCRWSHQQCLASSEPIDCNGDPELIPDGYESCCNATIPKTVQERSWTSPIWYNKPPAGC